MTTSQNSSVALSRLVPGLAALALLAAVPQELHAQLPVVDQFEDGFLDPSLWTTRLGIPQGGASVTVSNGHAILVNRGHLVTVDQFDPEVLGPLCVSGDWTFVTTGDADFMQILLRSDGQIDDGNCCGETNSGIEFRILSNQTALTIGTRGGFAVGSLAQTGSITITQGTTYLFQIIDYGDGALSFNLEEKGNPANSASATATLVTDPTNTNHVVFHNRENAGRTAYLDNVTIKLLVDADGDGLLDIWETEHGLDPDDDGEINPDNGADGDPDKDKLSNLEEFNRGTDPKDDDSDDDGAKDGDEVTAGTEPTDPDTDRDGLLDGVETGTKIYAGPASTGTDPLDDDSDNDGVRDGPEVTHGSNPNDPASVPTGASLPIIDDFEDGVLDEVVWKTNLTIPQGGAAVREQNGRVELVARGHLVTAGQFDPADGGLRITGQWTFGSADDFMQVLTRTDGLPAGQYGETANGIEFYVSLTNATKIVDIRSRNTASIAITRDPAGSFVAAGGMTFDFEIIDDGAGALSFTMTDVGNPANTATTTATVVSDTFALNHVAFHNREGGRTSFLEQVSISRLVEDAPVRITGAVHDPAAGTLHLRWESAPGQLYNLRSETDLTIDPGTWPVFGGREDLEATPPENTLTIPLPAEPGRYFVIESFPAPPETILAEGFEAGAGGFTAVNHTAGTIWTLGDPASTGEGGTVETGNGGSTNCWGTDLGDPGFYANGTDTSLISPVIDLTGIAGATLSFAQAIDVLSGDTLVVNIIDDTTDTVIVPAIHTSTPDGDINTANWETVGRVAIGGNALGQAVRIEWRFTGTNDGTYLGAYIDDVMVTVP